MAPAPVAAGVGRCCGLSAVRPCVQCGLWPTRPVPAPLPRALNLVEGAASMLACGILARTACGLLLAALPQSMGCNSWYLPQPVGVWWHCGAV